MSDAERDLLLSVGDAICALLNKDRYLQFEDRKTSRIVSAMDIVIILQDKMDLVRKETP